MCQEDPSSDSPRGDGSPGAGLQPHPGASACSALEPGSARLRGNILKMKIKMSVAVSHVHRTSPTHPCTLCCTSAQRDTHIHLHTDARTHSGTQARACKRCACALWSTLTTQAFFTHTLLCSTHSDTHMCTSMVVHTCTLFIITLLCFEHVTCIDTHTKYVIHTSVFSIVYGHAHTRGTPVYAPWHTQTHAPWFTLWYIHTLIPSRYITLLEANPQPEISLHI